MKLLAAVAKEMWKLIHTIDVRTVGHCQEAFLLHLSTGCVHLCIVQGSILKERVEPIQRISSLHARILVWCGHVQRAPQTVELFFWREQVQEHSMSVQACLSR